jgi:diphthamide biosynthesis protein 7
LTDVDGKALAQILEPDDIPMVSHIRTLQYAPEDVLVTAFSWHPKDSRVGMSLSSGEILLASTTEGYSPEVMFTHELEAWTLAFLPGGQGFYSGGDDSVLGFSEIRGTREDRYRPSWADLKIHEAGVTAILPLQTNNDKHLVLTGSYDDHIRLLEIPAIGRRKVMAEMNLGGGVWRLKIVTRGNFEPSEPGDAPDNILLLASCMHAGARIVRLFRSGEDDWRFEVLAKFEKHKSMNYGSDCQPQVTEIGQHTFLTTSFYDRLLCLWRY